MVRLRAGDLERPFLAATPNVESENAISESRSREFVRNDIRYLGIEDVCCDPSGVVRCMRSRIPRVAAHSGLIAVIPAGMRYETE